MVKLEEVGDGKHKHIILEMEPDLEKKHIQKMPLKVASFAAWDKGRCKNPRTNSSVPRQKRVKKIFFKS